MKLKDLEKVTKIYDEIKVLDESIKSLHKLAESVANGNSNVKLNLNITDLKLKEKTDKENLFDEDGSLKTTEESSMPVYISSFYGTAVKVKTTPIYQSNYTEALSDIMILQLIGVLIENKQAEKNILISKLSKFKITL